MNESSETVDTSRVGNETNPATTVSESKGKGKAVDLSPHDISMDEDDSSDEETGAEEEEAHEEAPEEEDEDNMEEIDTSNIISDGRRTRGKTIDFAKAAENAGDEFGDDDDDEDFEVKDDEEMKD